MNSKTRTTFALRATPTRAAARSPAVQPPAARRPTARPATLPATRPTRALTSAAAVTALAALAQESRLAVFRLLVEAGPEGLPAGEIAGRLGIANTTLSFHLKELVHAGLIHAAPQGRFILYAPDIARMNDLVGFLTDNCCGGAGGCGPDDTAGTTGTTGAVRCRPTSPG